MAFPTVEATAEYTESTSTATHPIDLPTGITAGDLLLVFAATTGNADTSFRVPLGWNIYYWGTDSSGSDNRVVGLVRVADGTEGSTVTVEVRISLRMVAHSYRISGFNSDNPLYPNNVGPDDYDMSLVERAFGPVLGVSRRKLNASSEDPSAFTLANSTAWGTSTVAVHPASAGTFPEAVAQTGDSTFSSTTSHVTDLPSGINSGDLLLAFFNRRNTDDDITWPAGWTVITSFASGDNRLEIAYREADGTEGTDITITTGSIAHSSRAVYRITDAEDPSTQAPEVATASGTSSDANPPSLTPTGGAQDYLWFATFQQDNDSAFPHQSESTAVGSSGNPDPPSITPDAGADDYLWLALCHIIDTDDPPSAPTNYTNLLLNAVFNNGFATAQRELNASSEDPGTFDAGGANQTDTWVAGTLVVQPAATGTTENITGTSAGISDDHLNHLILNLSGPHESTGTSTDTMSDLVLRFRGDNISAGTSLDTASVSALDSISGTGAGVSTDTAIVSALKALSGTSAGVSDDSGVIQALIKEIISGTSAGVSTDTGAVVAKASLSGTAAGASLDTAAADLAIALSGLLAGTSLDTGVITTDAVTLITGTSAGVSTDTAAADLLVGLSGTTAGASTDTALISKLVSILGTGAGVSDDTAAIQKLVAMTGTGAGTSTDTGVTNTAFLITGTSPGGSSDSAVVTLIGTAPISGTSAGVSEDTGILSISGLIELSGTSIGTSLDSVDSILVHIRGDNISIGTSDDTGSITSIHSISATGEGVSEDTGRILTTVGRVLRHPLVAEILGRKILQSGSGLSNLLLGEQLDAEPTTTPKTAVEVVKPEDLQVMTLDKDAEEN